MSSKDYSGGDLARSLLRALEAEQAQSRILRDQLDQAYERVCMLEFQLATLRAQVKQALPTTRLDSTS